MPDVNFKVVKPAIFDHPVFSVLPRNYVPSVGTLLNLVSGNWELASHGWFYTISFQMPGQSYPEVINDDDERVAVAKAIVAQRTGNLYEALNFGKRRMPHAG